MKNVEESVGIDVSKQTIDVYLYCKKVHEVFSNKKSGFIKMEKWIRKENYDLVMSVRGVGKILATQLLLHTQNFTIFDNARQFSAYCGIAPYPYQSGTSIKGSPRVHSKGDKKMKSLINTCAVSAIQHDNELKAYYLRRIAEGKPKMLVLNIIRNKLIARAFATIKRGTPFVELNQFAA